MKLWIRNIEIIAKDVKDYSISFESVFTKGYCCQGIELIEVKQGLGLVPTDYTGWFIQLRSRLNENPQGLFFQHYQLKENKLSLHLRNLDDASHQLWVEAGKYVAT